MIDLSLNNLDSSFVNTSILLFDFESKWKFWAALKLLYINRKIEINHKNSRTGKIKHTFRYSLTKFVAGRFYGKLAVLF